MTAATASLRNTSDILAALLDRLREITLSEFEDAPAFEKVDLFDLADWEDALRRLAMNQQRSAVLIWAGEDWQHNRETTVLSSKRTQDFELLISERRLDAPVAALTGDDLSPGVVGLKDLVVAALLGVLLEAEAELEGVYITVQNVQRAVLSVDDKKKDAGRQVLILSLQAEGDWFTTAVGAHTTY